MLVICLVLYSDEFDTRLDSYSSCQGKHYSYALPLAHSTICNVDCYRSTNDDREKCMDTLEQLRRKQIYPYEEDECSESCRNRGNTDEYN